MPIENVNQQFQAIYDAALNNEANTLQTLIKEGISIDVERDKLTAAQALAILGNKNAVELLRNNKAKWKPIVLGYVKGGHYQLANDVIDSEETIESERRKSRGGNYIFLSSNPAKRMAYKLAKVGATEFLVQLLKRYPTIDPSDCATYAISNGHQELAEILRVSFNARIHGIAEIAAGKGMFDYCDYLLTQGAAPSYIALGYARIGALDKIEALREYATKHSKELFGAASMASAAAAGGHFAYAEKILAEAPERERYFIIESILVCTKQSQPEYYEQFKLTHLDVEPQVVVDEGISRRGMMCA